MGFGLQAVLSAAVTATFVLFRLLQILTIDFR
jgi:hypothetical protein